MDGLPVQYFPDRRLDLYLNHHTISWATLSPLAEGNHPHLVLLAVFLDHHVEAETGEQRQQSRQQQEQRHKERGEPHNQTRLEIVHQYGYHHDYSDYCQQHGHPAEEAHGPVLLEERHDGAQHLHAVAEGI